MGLYFKIMFYLLAVMFWIGVAGPFCISNSTPLVLGYIVASIVLVPLSIKFFRGKK